MCFQYLYLNWATSAASKPGCATSSTPASPKSVDHEFVERDNGLRVYLTWADEEAFRAWLTAMSAAVSSTTMTPGVHTSQGPSCWSRGGNEGQTQRPIRWGWQQLLLATMRPHAPFDGGP